MNTEIIDIKKENIEEYGLFCKKSQKKEQGYKNKVEWVKARFQEGLKYKLLWLTDGYKQPTSRGFIEYIPGEYNWRGIHADGWMVIHCLWTTGKAKNQGNGSKLLEEAIKDAKQQKMYGVTVVTSPKCSGLPKSSLFEKAGFVMVDESIPNHQLYALIFDENAPLPKFNNINEEVPSDLREGVILIDGCQCPYVQSIVEPIKEVAKSVNLPFKVKNYIDCRDAQTNGITPYAVYGVILNGKVISYCFPRRTTEITDIIKNYKKKT